MRSRKLEMSFVVAVGTCILSLSLGADRKQRIRSPEKTPLRQTVDEDDFVKAEKAARVNAVLSNNGYWTIAGVVALSKDPDGRNVIEVKMDGDFERDMVLTLPVQVIELDSGEMVVYGLERVTYGSDTLTLYVHDVSVGGVAAEECSVLPPPQFGCRRNTCTTSCTPSGGGCDCGTIVGPEP